MKLVRSMFFGRSLIRMPPFFTSDEKVVWSISMSTMSL